MFLNGFLLLEPVFCSINAKRDGRNSAECSTHPESAKPPLKTTLNIRLRSLGVYREQIHIHAPIHTLS